VSRPTQTEILKINFDPQTNKYLHSSINSDVSDPSPPFVRIFAPEGLIPDRHPASGLVSWWGLGPNKLCRPDVVLEGPGSGIQQRRDFLLMRLARVSVGLGGRKMSAVICVVGIGVVAAMLFVAFNNTEPNRRLCLCPQAPHHLCERCGNRRKSDALIAHYTYPEVRLTYAQRYHHLTGGPYLMGNTSFCGQANPARDKYRCPSLTDQQGPRSQQRRSVSFRQ